MGTPVKDTRRVSSLTSKVTSHFWNMSSKICNIFLNIRKAIQNTLQISDDQPLKTEYDSKVDGKNMKL